MLALITRLIREDVGQDLIEYGLLAALISVIAVIAITSVGTKLVTSFTSLAAGLP